MKFRKIIKQITPYGLVMKVHEKNRSATFWELYKQYLANGEYVEFNENSDFKYVTSVQGFCYSGASAVIDLLREYDNTSVLGYIDYNSKAESVKYNIEVDFMRFAGGLLEFEKFLGCHNIFHNDALLQRYMKMVQESPIFMNIEESRKLFFELFRQLSFSFGREWTKSYFNTHIQQADERHPQLFFLRNLTIDEYRNICRKFINSLFSLICKERGINTLVLDQFFGDMTYNEFQRNYAYCPNLKTIYVFRDPRDMYEEMIQRQIEIPFTNVETFIKWFEIFVSGLKPKDTKDYISVRFEDLVLNYEQTVSKIENYLGLNSKQHNAVRSSFDPTISIRSVRLWQKHPEHNKDYEMIVRELPDYLYSE